LVEPVSDGKDHVVHFDFRLGMFAAHQNRK
jgi:hypothetical protein